MLFATPESATLFDENSGKSLCADSPVLVDSITTRIAFRGPAWCDRIARLQDLHAFPTLRVDRIVSLRLTNLRAPVEMPEADLGSAIAKQLTVRGNDIARWRILRKSLDARQKKRLEFVYSVVVDLADPQSINRLLGVRNLSEFVPSTFPDPEPGPTPMEQRPVVVGSGPAGLLAGFYLAQKGMRPLVIERGPAVKERVTAIRGFDRGGDFEQDNNYLFGEGGAGCFSDGKLTCRITGPDVDWVLERFVECGGRESLTYEHRPHLGSNKLPMICRNFRRKIEQMGGEYRFSCKLEDISLADGQIKGVNTSSGFFETNHLILATGHSARDTYEMLHRSGVPMVPKAFQLGLRIEHPQEQINSYKYGRDNYLSLLGAADYSLVAESGSQRDIFTFCMCAGGVVIPSVSEPSMYCSNGMSNSRHNSPFGNSGLVATLRPEEFGSTHPLSGVELQRKYESLAFELAGRNYFAPIQSVRDFLRDRDPDPKKKLLSSYERGTRPLNLSNVLPQSILSAIREGLPVMDRKWRGRYLENATLVGPEMRGSSPVRINRDRETWQCPGINGFYPVGEGAGYAGGIVTAAVDGLRAARKIVEAFHFA